MNMKNEEKIYQLNTYNIAEYTSTDYTDNDIAILGDFKNLLFNKYWKIQCKLPPKTKRFCPLVLK